MKKIINGKIYNTETATKIAEKTPAELTILDEEYFKEDLYVTKNGNFFIYGIGGIDTSYNDFPRNENIFAITKDEVLKIAEESNLSIDSIVKYIDGIEEA